MYTCSRSFCWWTFDPGEYGDGFEHGETHRNRYDGRCSMKLVTIIDANDGAAALARLNALAKLGLDGSTAYSAPTLRTLSAAGPDFAGDDRGDADGHLAVLRSFIRDSRGASLIEYAVLLSVLAAALMLALPSLGSALDALLGLVESELTVAGSSEPAPPPPAPPAGGSKA